MLAYQELTQNIIGAAIEVHSVLGPGLLESVYEDALCIELALREIKYERQKPFTLTYKGKSLRAQKVDLIVEGTVVVELKARRTPGDLVLSQMLSYLSVTSLEIGLVLNFGVRSMRDGIRRVIRNREIT